jgi:hypothetical protein
VSRRHRVILVLVFSTCVLTTNLIAGRRRLESSRVEVEVVVAFESFVEISFKNRTLLTSSAATDRSSPCHSRHRITQKYQSKNLYSSPEEQR